MGTISRKIVKEYGKITTVWGTNLDWNRKQRDIRKRRKLNMELMD